LSQIPDDVIQAIRDRVDFLAIVQKRVELKRMGRAWKGLCPFHNERSPSFHVHPERGFYHCFGCQASGDVFKYLMETEHQPFPIIAKDLAKELGIDIPENHESADEKRAREKREWLYRTNDYLNQYFMHQYWTSKDAAHARAYVQGRGLHEDTVRAFQIGYAPRRADDLLKYLEAKRLPKELAIELGVLGKRDDGSLYLRFFDRVLFPIHDERDRIAGFGGRVLDKDAKAAKYLNSPESPIFKKSKLLYGFSKAKNSIARKGSAWLCEGYLDVIAMHQAGLDQAVAPLGTALTEDHLPILKRVTSRVHTMFDGDSAGLRATRKSTELLLAHGFSVSVVALPDGDDPDTLVLREGAEATAKRIADAPAAVQFFIEKAAREMPQTVEGRVDAAKDIGPLLQKMASQLERDLYVSEAAKRLQIEPESLRRFFGWKAQNTAFSETPPRPPSAEARQEQRQPKKQATDAPAPPRIPAPDLKELEWIGRLLRVRASWETLQQVGTLVTHEGLKALLSLVVQDPEIDEETLVTHLGSGKASKEFNLWLSEDHSSDYDEYQLELLKTDVSRRFRDYSIRREIAALKEELSRCAEVEKQMELLSQLKILNRRVHASAAPIVANDASNGEDG
jgi:DNA primase